MPRLPSLRFLTYTSLPQAEQAHAHLLKSGLAGDTHIATKLLSAYARHRRFPDAVHLLDSLPNPDPFSFSTLISALSAAGRFSHSLSLLRRMLSLSLPPDPFVLPTALKACAALPSISSGRQVHALAVSAGLSLDPFIQSSLVHMYLKCGATSHALYLFDGITQQTVVSLSAIIAGYAQRGFVSQALQLFDRMRGSGVDPNSVTWNGMVAGFNRSGLTRDAVSVFRRMHSEDFSLDETSVSSVLPAAGDIEDGLFGMQVHAYSAKAGLEMEAWVSSALVDMYGKCGLTEEMSKVFEDVGQTEVGSCNALVSGLSRNCLTDDALCAFRRFKGMGIELNVVSWTSIVACCAQNGKDVEALELFREMQAVGIKPNRMTISAVLPACADIAALTHGRSVHCFALRMGISDDVYASSSFVDMYAKCGRIKDARNLFDAMPMRNVVSWNAMISGYAMHGFPKDAIEMFHLMHKTGQKPDLISYTCVLSACSQGGLTEEGRYFFNRMAHEHGLVARMEHYACMVSLLGRAGKLDEAYDLVQDMKFEPDACVWGALLSSCRVHGHVKLGEIAAEKLFKLEPANPGNYVLLSNIYAGKGMWGGVDRVRDIMKEIGIRKNPGCAAGFR